MFLYMGLDIGSAYSKGVLLRDAELIDHFIIRSGYNYQKSAETIRRELLDKNGIHADKIHETLSTGTGGGNIPYAVNINSDILCIARGIHHLFPGAKMAIDIGGQSTKVLHISEEGRVTNFAVTEKCAAGSGRFIEIIAKVLQIDLKDFGELSLQSEKPITFSTGCAVFGESEVITRVAQAVPKENIAAGANKAIGEKILSLTKKIGLKVPCVLCGGGALNKGLVKTIERGLNIEIIVPDQPQIIAALGAALSAETLKSKNHKATTNG